MLLSHELTNEKKVFVSRLARAEVRVVFCSVFFVLVYLPPHIQFWKIFAFIY